LERAHGVVSLDVGEGGADLVGTLVGIEEMPYGMLRWFCTGSQKKQRHLEVPLQA
jgi:hypothetical protein